MEETTQKTYTYQEVDRMRLSYIRLYVKQEVARIMNEEGKKVTYADTMIKMREAGLLKLCVLRDKFPGKIPFTTSIKQYGYNSGYNRNRRRRQLEREMVKREMERLEALGTPCDSAKRLLNKMRKEGAFTIANFKKAFPDEDFTGWMDPKHSTYKKDSADMYIGRSLHKLRYYYERPEWCSEARWRMELGRRLHKPGENYIDPDSITAPDNRVKRYKRG